MLPNLHNVAKMLPVKSESACSLTRVFQGNPPDFSGLRQNHNDLQADRPEAISNAFSKDL